MTDIVARLRQGAYNDSLDDQTMQEAADTIEFLRTEIERLGSSLDKCHAQLMRYMSPVVDSRNDYEGTGQAPYHPSECGGFQGHED